jgi:hypothetical protein
MMAARLRFRTSRDPLENKDSRAGVHPGSSKVRENRGSPAILMMHDGHLAEKSPS